MRSLILSWCVLALAGTTACSGGGDSSARLAIFGDSDASTRSGNLDADASVDESDDGDDGPSDDGTDAGADDAGIDELPMPKAAAPCDEDLSFVGGEVRPDLGDVGTTDAASADPEKPGAYAVFKQDIKIPIAATQRSAAGYDISIEAGELSGTLYAPSSDDGTSIDEGSFPLIMVLPGFQASYTMYAHFAEHFASHGFVVVGVDTRSEAGAVSHDKEALEISLSIDWALSESAAKSSIDATKIATSGHSKGGKVSFFTAAIDDRVDLAFGWDPSNAGGPPCGLIADLAGQGCNAQPVAPNCGAEADMVPMPEGVMQYTHAESFIFGVPPDNVNPSSEHNAIHFYRGAPSPADLVYFDDGHLAWLAGIGNDDVIRITKAVQTAKLLTAFYGAKGLDKYLPGGNYLKNEAKVSQVEQK